MSGGIGISQDVVEIKLAGKTVIVTENYDIQSGVFAQPAGFAIKLGHRSAILDLIKAAPPNTPFELRIDGNPQFVGTTDGFVAAGSSSGSALTIRGRDRLAPLHDGYVRSEQSFSDITYADLVKKGLDDVLKGKDYVLSFSNDANRKAVTGAPKVTANHSAERLATTEVFFFGETTVSFGGTNTGRVGVTETQTLVSAGTATGVAGGAGIADTKNEEPVAQANSGGQKAIQAKMEQRWYDGVIKPELDRAGLFLFCGADGSFILSAPDINQATSYRITRRPNMTVNGVVVVDYELRHETTQRHSTFEVHLRRGGGKETRSKGLHVVTDQEMVALGYDRPICFKDNRCKSNSQAEFYARRKLCETRRQGWSLTYTVSGHTVIGVDGTRIVWTPDTIVEVDDEELGIKDKFYVESVQFSRNPATTTKLHLMRPADLVFGELE